MSSYVPGSFYGGYPNPTRANPSGAGLYTHSGGVGVWRTGKTGANPLPADWPPLPPTKAYPIEGDYQNPGETDNAVLTFQSSTNGIVEYTASGFRGTMKGHLLVASFDGTIHKITLDDAGTAVINTQGNKRLNEDLPIASNFGAEPIDLTVQGDNAIFPGTIWAACYGGNSIYVFEPEEGTTCDAVYSATVDNDGDGFSNADEIDNGSNPCSQASKPKDSDGDGQSDFNDADDDNDGIADTNDHFPLDAANGKTTNLPITYELFNNDLGRGLFGLGFTGLMLPKQNGFNYQDLFDEQNLVAGGAVGALSVVSVSEGDPYHALNNQENAFQFGVNVSRSTGPFTVRTRMLGPFFNAPHARDHFQAVVIGNKLYAAGGRRSSQNTGQTFMLTVPEVDIYDFATGQWSTSTNPIPTQRAGTTTVALDGNVVVIGGESSQATAHNETEAFSPMTKSWLRLANLQQGRHGTQAILNNQAIYIVVGSGSQGGNYELSSQEVYYKSAPTTPTGTQLAQSQLVSPTSGAFGQVAVSSTQSSLIKLTNSGGNQAILVTGISLSGSTNFTFQSPITLPFILPVGQSVDVKVDFKPSSTGSKNGSLVIAHSGAVGTLSVPLSGSGVSGSQQAVTSFSLINADNDQVIRVLANNDVINLPSLPSPRINIRANTSPTTVGSVLMALSGTQNQTAWETTAPYALFGDNNGDFNPWTPAVGNYTLNGTPYTGPNGSGTAGNPLRITFTVTNTAGAKVAAESLPLTEQGRGWRFFPNPLSGVIRIELEPNHTLPFTVDIMDIMGRSLLHERKESLEAVMVNLHDFLPGIYILTIRSKTGVVSRKLIKQ